MEPERQEWINAAKKLIENKNEQVLCPSCSKSFLLVKDEPIYQWKKIDRYLICELCGKHNVITGNFKNSDFYFTDDANTL
jgi:Zn finger protein HypA/HybF involved in hydrogenase expression